MDNLDDVIRAATASIAEKYYSMPIDGSTPIYRERVYCYELYHQMRCLWGDCPYTLGGEVDKKGHALLSSLGITGGIPDLLIHGPGNMKHNLAIIEVKASGLQRGMISDELIKADVAKLVDFVVKARYRHALFLVFGELAVPSIADTIAAIERPCPIELWLHPTLGEPAYKIDIPATRQQSSSLLP
jgi:hypothetical protein